MQSFDESKSNFETYVITSYQSVLFESAGLAGVTGTVIPDANPS
jgi:hypothetical protein